MREAFQEHLAGLEKRIESDLELAIATLADVASAVADTAAPTPSSIERNADRLRDASREADEALVTTIARQAPVCRDLRLVISLIQLAHHEGLIANQFELISAQLMETDPDVPDNQGTGEKLARMAKLAGSQLASATIAFARRDDALARQVGRDDDAIDQLNREIFATTLEVGGDSHQREVALRHVLIARSLERIGDNAVDIAEHAAYLATGQLREFSDASHPEASSPAPPRP
jgi:phosphate transport system protein